MMEDLQRILKEYSPDVNAVNDWCNEMYNTLFSHNFSEVRVLYNQLHSKSRQISDSELEYILTVLPLSLFSVAEALNKFRTSLEVTKLKMKQKKKELAEGLSFLTESKRNVEIQYQLVEDEILCTAYNSVISQVEGELSFSRELIMGAKKIYDGRRSAEQACPIGGVSTPGDDLPEYRPNQYIR